MIKGKDDPNDSIKCDLLYDMMGPLHGLSVSIELGNRGEPLYVMKDTKLHSMLHVSFIIQRVVMIMFLSNQCFTVHGHLFQSQLDQKYFTNQSRSVADDQLHRARPRNGNGGWKSDQSTPRTVICCLEDGGCVKPGLWYSSGRKGQVGRSGIFKRLWCNQQIHRKGGKWSVGTRSKQNLLKS